MRHSLTKHWRLFWQFRSIELMRLFEYRTDFFVWTAVSLIWTIFNFFFFSLLIRVNDSIAGWSEWELYLVLSVFTMLDAFTWSFMHRNMKLFTEDVFNGGLSTWMMKPIDLQFLLMTRRNSFNNLPRLILGLTGVFVSIWQLGLTPSPLQWLLFVISLCTGLWLVYTLWMCLSTLSLWIERLDNINEIVPGLRRIWQVPNTVFTGISSTFLTVILPLGLVTTLPSQVLLNSYSWGQLGYLLVFTVILTLVTRKWFNWSVRKYSSVGG